MEKIYKVRVLNTIRNKSTRPVGDLARWRDVILALITPCCSSLQMPNAKPLGARRSSRKGSIERASNGRRVKQCELLRAGACGDCVTSNFKLSIARGLGVTSRGPHNARSTEILDDAR